MNQGESSIFGLDIDHEKERQQKLYNPNLKSNVIQANDIVNIDPFNSIDLNYPKVFQQLVRNLAPCISDQSTKQIFFEYLTQKQQLELEQNRGFKFIYEEINENIVKLKNKISQLNEEISKKNQRIKSLNLDIYELKSEMQKFKELIAVESEQDFDQTIEQNRVSRLQSEFKQKKEMFESLQQQKVKPLKKIYLQIHSEKAMLEENNKKKSTIYLNNQLLDNELMIWKRENNKVSQESKQIRIKLADAQKIASSKSLSMINQSEEQPSHMTPRSISSQSLSFTQSSPRTSIRVSAPNVIMYIYKPITNWVCIGALIIWGLSLALMTLNTEKK